MNPKVVLWNGPKEVGKDYAIQYLIDSGLKVQRHECKDKLHKLTQEIFCVDSELYFSIYNDRELKEVPNTLFKITPEEFYKLKRIIKGISYSDTGGALSIRQALIYVSEIICKPHFGEDYFGVARAKSIPKETDSLIVDGSCGFIEEIQPLIDKVRQDNILLIRVYREGHTFEGDSRRYIPNGILKNSVDVYNDSTIKDYYDETIYLVRKFLKGGFN